METALLSDCLPERAVRFATLEQNPGIRKLHGKRLKSMLQGHPIPVHWVQQGRNSKKG
jgi:hypothetical protein